MNNKPTGFKVKPPEKSLKIGRNRQVNMNRNANSKMLLEMFLLGVDTFCLPSKYDLQKFIFEHYRYNQRVEKDRTAFQLLT